MARGKLELLGDWVVDQVLYPLYAMIIESLKPKSERDGEPDDWPVDEFGVSDSYGRMRGGEAPPAGNFGKISEAVKPAKYYGDGGTIHHTGHIDVVVDKDGNVREVMFRCQWLPFNQVSFEHLRHDGVAVPMPKRRIKGIVTEGEE